MVVFGQNWLHFGKLVRPIQNSSTWAKWNLHCSGQNGCFGQNVQNGCIWATEMAKWLYLGKIGCIWSKLVVFRQKWLYLGKFNGCIWHNSIHEKLLDSNWLRAL